MKRYIILSILVVAFVFTACKSGSTTTDEMTPEQTIEVMSVKIHKDGKNPELYFVRADALMKVGRVNEAINDLLKATQLDGSKIEYHLLLADAYMANGNMEKSYQSLTSVLELDADNQTAMLKQGEISYYSKDYDRALASLSAVTEKDPTNRVALTIKSSVYKEMGDTNAAVILLRKVCDLYPDYGLAFEELGALYATRLDPLAVEYLNTAIRLDPKNINALYILAMYYQDTKHVDEAENVYRQILAVDSTYKDAWHNMGYIELFTYGDYPIAVEYFTHALEIDSFFVEARVNRACAYELDDDRDRALRDFRIAHDQRPTYQPAIDGLARLGVK